MSRNQIIINIALASIVLGLCIYQFVPYGKRTGYVVLSEVFGEFTLKKELEKELTARQKSREMTVDSMKSVLTLRARTINSESNKATREQMIQEYQGINQQFSQRQEALVKQNQDEISELNHKIYLQMNEYINQYGKAHGYKYIFGTTNEGNLMFANEAENVTKEITVYINSAYEGK